ncbi:MAG: histidinol dehydrogenase [Planctomycetota bacterium]
MIDIRDYHPADEVFRRILHRAETGEDELWDVAMKIVQDVRKRGDAALFEYARQYDGTDLSPETIRVPREELASAKRSVSEAFLSAVTQAMGNIRRFHEYQTRSNYVHDDGDGVLLAKRVMPLRRSGVCCPAGSAPLFSSLLMNVIPAQIAGVEEIAVVTPPGRDGRVNPHILATAALLGLEEIYRVGGAHAVAALAFGTASIPRVDVIVGPGHPIVQIAKKIVFGAVGIDAIAGASELVIIADASANAEYVAADLLSQLEHGSGLESGVVLTMSRTLAEAVRDALARQIPGLARAESIERCLKCFSAIFLVKSLEEAVEAANAIAPEHLEIQTQDPEAVAEGLRNAGAIFLGAASTEPVGDYFCGTNHVLPTGGAARFSGSLSVYDFLKDTSIVRYTLGRLAKTGRHIIDMAEVEGLTAHANAIRVRMQDLGKGA